METNAYICKNLFSFLIDQKSCFGEEGGVLSFAPKNYSSKNRKIANVKFRIHHVPEEYKEMIPQWEQKLEELAQSEETVRTDIEMMSRSPFV